MAIDPEFLNAKVRHEGTIRTGVFMSDMRNTAVVVRVKNGHVTFLSWLSNTLRLETVLLYSFARDWPISLPNYPTRRALLRYRDGGLAIDPAAAAALRAIVG